MSSSSKAKGDARISLQALRKKVEDSYAFDRLGPGCYGQTHFALPRDRLLALVEAVEADHALAVAEERGFDLDPAEHRELIARHDNALARFDFGDPDAP